jgi:hypothetical protein
LWPNFSRWYQSRGPPQEAINLCTGEILDAGSVGPSAFFRQDQVDRGQHLGLPAVAIFFGCAPAQWHYLFVNYPMYATAH